MYRHIMVPVDGSMESEQAVDVAIQLAKVHEAVGTVMTVLEEADQTDMDGYGTEPLKQRLTEAERRTAERRLQDSIAETESGSIPVEFHIEAGEPARSISDFVDSSDIDLLVLGADDYGGILSHILGSTTQRIIRSCNRPVLLI